MVLKFLHCELPEAGSWSLESKEGVANVHGATVMGEVCYGGGRGNLRGHGHGRPEAAACFYLSMGEHGCSQASTASPAHRVTSILPLILTSHCFMSALGFQFTKH